MDCSDRTDCSDEQHHEYRTWPVRLPAPRWFRRGTWPLVASPAGRVWVRLRSLGVVRLHHL